MSIITSDNIALGATATAGSTRRPRRATIDFAHFGQTISA